MNTRNSVKLFFLIISVAWQLVASSSVAVAQEDTIPESFSITDQGWTAFINRGGQYSTEFDGELFEHFESMGLNYWAGDSDFSSNLLSPDHMYEQTYFFRSEDLGFGDREYNLAELEYNEGTGDGNQAMLSYQSAGKLAVDVDYEITGTPNGASAQTSKIESNVTFKNLSEATAEFSLFSYVDLDLDFIFGNDSVFLSPAADLTSEASAGTRSISPLEITQVSPIGSRVTYRVTPGADDYQIDTFPNLISRLEDDEVDSPSNDFRQPISTVDVTYVLQNDFSLAPNESITLGATLEGVFSTVVLPDEQTNNEDGTGTFLFDVEDPATEPGSPTWFDPETAVGYTYRIEESFDNAFTQLYLPDGLVDGIYTLEILSDDHSLSGELITVYGQGGELSFDFIDTDDDGDASGVQLFRILGIETDAFLDPQDQTAFPTGLVFANGQPFSFTQTSILAVPEPTGGLSLFVVAACLVRRRQRI